mmetsp:Transcript_133/g.331  ORF Transcript_133/g.331 Transcript_133/m.331 type:complete len:213 (-) Transcript_133:137-775(-)
MSIRSETLRLDSWFANLHQTIGDFVHRSIATAEHILLDRISRYIPWFMVTFRGRGDDIQILIPMSGGDLHGNDSTMQHTAIRLDTFLFMSTAVITTVSSWVAIYIRGRSKSGDDSDTPKPSDTTGGDRSIAKAKVWRSPKRNDDKLHQFMDQARKQKGRLRKVQDPDVNRTARMEQLRKTQTPSGPLQLTDQVLKSSRQGLSTPIKPKPQAR